jgi:hypothetical protein
MRVTKDLLGITRRDTHPLQERRHDMAQIMKPDPAKPRSIAASSSVESAHFRPAVVPS